MREVKSGQHADPHPLRARDAYNMGIEVGEPAMWANCSEPSVRRAAYSGFMNKRLEKKHKRQVSRAKENKKTSEPDVRTHQQIEAARQASRAVNAASNRSNRPVLTTSAA